jgi:intraflagellar transport protein 46
LVNRAAAKMADGAAPAAAQLQQLFAYADAYTPPECQLPALRLQPFIPDYVPAIGAPNSFTAPPRPDGAPDFLGLTVLDEPALRQSDPAILELQLRQQHRQQEGGGGSGGSDAQPPLGWVADPARKPWQLEAWIDQVEVLHQVGADHQPRMNCDISCLGQQ